MQSCSQRQLQQADTFPFLVASVKSGSARVTRSLQPAAVTRRVMMMGGNWAEKMSPALPANTGHCSRGQWGEWRHWGPWSLTLAWPPGEPRQTEQAGTKYCSIQSLFCRAVAQLPPNQGEKERMLHTFTSTQVCSPPWSRPSCSTAALPRDGSGGDIVKLVLQSAAGLAPCMLRCSVMRQLHAKMQISPSATLKPSSASSPSTIRGEEEVWKCSLSP